MSWMIEQKRRLKRIKYMMSDGLPYFQPTLSPAGKNDVEIESVEEALKYYAEDFNEVFIQRKYMGSYCVMVLDRDHAHSKFFSRNGFPIRISGVHGAALHIHQKAMEMFDFDKIIIEAELMPWSALGSGLIEDDFKNYHILHSEYLDFLRMSNVMSVIQQLQQEQYPPIEEMKDHERKQVSSIMDIGIPDFKEYQHGIDLFKEQLDIFGKDDYLHFAPFNVIKYSQGGEEFHLFEHTFIGDESDCIRINVNDIHSAKVFFNEQKGLHQEGVVVKPVFQQRTDLAPALKVRTKEYLHMIYGVNFFRNFDYYLKKRNTNRKLRASTNGYALACELLKIPFNELTPENKKYERILSQILDCEIIIQTLDNRL